MTISNLGQKVFREGSAMRILVVDDDHSIRMTLKELLSENYEVEISESANIALGLLEKSAFDLVITDNQMPGISGLELIKKGSALYSSTSFVLMTAYASIEQAVESIRQGAEDYIMKPFDIDDMEHRVKRIEKLRAWKNEAELKNEPNSLGVKRLIGSSKNIKDSKEFIEKVADVSSPVLVLGPTGTGKEIISKAIHETSKRASRAFVGINCASLNEQLIESELFGHEKGAFTGAVSSKPGKFELASGGTIFLDEIGELSLQLQARLLRVLQEKEFTRVGGVKILKTDARVIAATHRNLKLLVSEGKFREDLYFRLNVISFETCPLSKRKEDIPSLIESIWSTLQKELVRKSVLSEKIKSSLINYSYPGNIRELKNVLERLIVLGPVEGEIPSELLPSEILSGGVKAPAEINRNDETDHPEVLLDYSQGLEKSIEALESHLIRRALDDTGNNQVKAAELLKIPRGTLQYKIRKMS